MSEVQQVLPLGTHCIKVRPGEIIEGTDPEMRIAFRMTMAALDVLNPVDDKKEPSVLRMIRMPEGDEDEEDDEDFDGEEDDDEDEDDEDEDEDDEDDDEDDEDDDMAVTDLEDPAVVLCTLAPNVQFQQPLDLVITPHEGVYFQVVGSYPIHLSGNFLDHPYDRDSEDEEDEDFSEDEESDESDSDELDEEIDDEEVDLTPDEDELQSRIQELTAPKQPKKEAKKEAKQPAKKEKRPAEEPAVPEPKKAKKEANGTKEKKVEFSKSLEKGPEATEAKFPTKKLEGGVVIEDRKIGKGPQAKNGQKIEMRYVGKLKNGKVFDKNTSGKPFSFKLGKGEVIKGWDVGVAGMAAGGERRIIIPAPMAYGKQALPGLPANSELVFDVKLVGLK